MDNGCLEDGVFVGRHVLVEYDKEMSFKILYYGKYNNGSQILALYSDDTMEEGTRVLNINKDEVIQVKVQEPEANDTTATIHFYKCLGSNNSGEPFFEFLDIKDEVDNYIKNYQIDKNVYGLESSNFRGYDSTVWIKVSKPSADGSTYELHYVQIADLNSVVPDFDVVADAPTMTPLPPHFDANTSSNLHYNLHVQTPYGFRVKEAEANEKSDAKTTWWTTTYNSKTNTTETQSQENVNAAIYFNAAGFNPEQQSEDTGTANYIKLEPSGRSGNIYEHENNQGDIQELSISLPAIGNAVSQVYDVLKGPERNDSQSESLNGILDSFKNIETGSLLIKDRSDNVIKKAELQGDNYIEVGIEGDKTLSIQHNNAQVQTDVINTDLNTAEKKQISIDKIEWDNAGHINKKTTNTVTLPYGYKYIKAGDNTSEATNTQDTYEIKSGNNIVVSSSDNIATIAHSTPGTLNVSSDDTNLISAITTDSARHVKEVAQTKLKLGNNNEKIYAKDSDEKETFLHSIEIKRQNAEILFDRTYSELAKLPTISTMRSDVNNMYTWGQNFATSFQDQVVAKILQRLHDIDGRGTDWDNILGPVQGGGGDSSTEKLTVYDEKYGFLIANIYKNGDGTITPSTGVIISNFSAENTRSVIQQEDGSELEFTIKEGVITDRVRIHATLAGANSKFIINGVEQEPESTSSTGSCVYNFVGIPTGEIYFKSTDGKIEFNTFIKEAETGGSVGNLLDENRNVKLDVLTNTLADCEVVDNNKIVSSATKIKLPTKSDLAAYSNYDTHLVIRVNNKDATIKIGDHDCTYNFGANNSSVLGIYYGVITEDIVITGGTEAEFIRFKVDSIPTGPIAQVSQTWEETFGKVIPGVDNSEERYIEIQGNSLIPHGSDVVGFFRPKSSYELGIKMGETVTIDKDLSVLSSVPSFDQTETQTVSSVLGWFLAQIPSETSITMDDFRVFSPSKHPPILPKNAYIETATFNFFQGPDGYFYSETNYPYDENYDDTLLDNNGFLRGNLVLPDFTGTVWADGVVNRVSGTLNGNSIDDLNETSPISNTEANSNVYFATIKASNETIKITSQCYLCIKEGDNI